LPTAHFDPNEGYAYFGDRTLVEQFTIESTQCEALTRYPFWV
jgi:hypothetical protein